MVATMRPPLVGVSTSRSASEGPGRLRGASGLWSLRGRFPGSVGPGGPATEPRLAWERNWLSGILGAALASGLSAAILAGVMILKPGKGKHDTTAQIGGAAIPDQAKVNLPASAGDPQASWPYPQAPGPPSPTIAKTDVPASGPENVPANSVPASSSKGSPAKLRPRRWGRSKRLMAWRQRAILLSHQRLRLPRLIRPVAGHGTGEARRRRGARSAPFG